MNNSGLVFTPAAQQAQAERGSAKAYARQLAEGFPDKVTPELAAFIAEQDAVFLATATPDGDVDVDSKNPDTATAKIDLTLSGSGDTKDAKILIKIVDENGKWRFCGEGQA